MPEPFDLRSEKRHEEVWEDPLFLLTLYPQPIKYASLNCPLNHPKKHDSLVSGLQ